MKDNRGFYAGLLKSYGILDDSIKSKDFYLIDVYFKTAAEDDYQALEGDGLLLNFADVLSVRVAKRIEAITEHVEIT